MNHLEFAASESAALKPTNWDRWIARLEKLCGHDLDGNQEKDGYSLDFCHDMFKAGKRPLDALYIIRWHQRGLHKAD